MDTPGVPAEALPPKKIWRRDTIRCNANISSLEAPALLADIGVTMLTFVLAPATLVDMILYV